MPSLADIYAAVKLDLSKEEEGRLRKRIASIDTKKEGAQVATRFGLGFNGAIGGIVSRSAGIFAAGFAAVQGVKVFAGFINDARESARVANLTAQVIKSTGGAAKVTADQVGDLATAISNKTGADDEAIQSGENLLLTFTNIRNGVGKGNDIFNQASQAVVDMTAALNGGQVTAEGMKSSSIQLGKALNNPIKGVTALQKVGVSFTEDQKKQIKTLVDSGKTMEAQKVILGELSKEFGGAAAAAGDPMTRLKTILGNLSEQIGGYLLPVVGKFADFVSDKAAPAISGLADLIFKGDFTKALGDAFNISEDSGFVDFILNLRTTVGNVFTEIIGGSRAFGAAWKANDGDVTSSGFPGFMERLANAARQAFGFFKSDVLPVLKQFGGFLIGTVVPAVATLAGNLISSLWPAVQSVFGFFKTEVLPRLQDFAGFLGTSVLPKIGDMATALSKNKDFLVPFVTVILGVVGALKAWAAIQAIVNVVMSANPIGLVVIAVAALVAGIIYAYKHSEKFRSIVQAAFDGVKKAAQVMGQVIGAVAHGLVDAFHFASPLIKAAIDIVIGVFKLWWNFYAKPILNGIVWLFRNVIAPALVALGKNFVAWGKTLIGAFNSIKDPAVAAIKFVVKVFLDMVGTLLNGAAKAFGWVPHLGPKLKAAAKEFGKFRDNVNAALNGVKDQTITVTAKLNAANVNQKNANDRRLSKAYAYGGAVRGPGSGTSDSIPAMLSNGEHVWTAQEVRRAGGHGAVEAMRREIRGYARGGAVVDVKSRFGNPQRFASEVATHAVTALRPAAQQLANQMFGPDGGPPGARKSFRGVTLNERTIRMLLNAERILGAMFHITQGSYSTRVAASGGTHAGGGAMDTNEAGKGWNAAVRALRLAGFASWHRVPSQGPWRDHIHSIALGDPTASPSAKAQMASFRRGGDGLGHGMRKGGRVMSYDTGAWKILADQLAMVHKGEMVVPTYAAEALRRMGFRGETRHQRHLQHVAHVQHLAHLGHVAQRYRRQALATGTADDRVILHPSSIDALALALASASAANPPRVELDGHRLDTAMSRVAIGRGL